jgi:hypothetical protein
MRYMLLIYGDPTIGPAPDSPELQAEMGNWYGYHSKLIESGKFIAGDPLEGTDTATTVRVRNGEQLTTDGPFAETKEILGGYYLINAENLDDAIEWAAKMPNISHGSVEVRPVADMPTG